MYTKNNLQLNNLLTPAAFFVGGVLLWHLAATYSGTPAFLLPPPGAVLSTFVENFSFLLRHLGITLLEAVTGYVLALLLALALATLFVHSKVFEQGLYPYIIGFKIIPVLAFLPFFVLWFGLGFTSKVAVVVAICLSPLIVNILKGLKTVDAEHLSLFQSLGATRSQVFFRLRLPSSLPHLFVGLKVTTMLAFTGAFVAEFVAGNQGLGYVIASSTRALESTLAFAAIGMAVVGGLAFFFLVTTLEKKVVFWQKSRGV